MSIMVLIPTPALNPYPNPNLKRNANPDRNRKPKCIPDPDTNVKTNAIPTVRLTLGLTLTVPPGVTVT